MEAAERIAATEAIAAAKPIADTAAIVDRVRTPEHAARRQPLPLAA